MGRVPALACHKGGVVPGNSKSIADHGAMDLLSKIQQVQIALTNSPMSMPCQQTPPATLVSVNSPLDQFCGKLCLLRQTCWPAERYTITERAQIRVI
jgi:hypothetical protein